MLDDILRDLYGELSDEITNSINSVSAFVSTCVSETVYSGLPDILQQKIKSVYSAMKRFKESNAKISKAFHTLPEGKCKEYSDYLIYNKSPENPIPVDYQILDNALKVIYNEIAGDIRNCGGAMTVFVELCERNKAELPDFPKEMLPAASGAANIFIQADKRVSEILDKIPEEKIREYSN